MLSILLIYLSLTLVGFFLLRAFTKETNLFRILPAGALFAVAIYIFLLNLSTQIIPGRVGIYIAASILIFIGIFVKLRFKKEDIQLDKLKSSNFILCLFIYFVVIGLAFLKMSTTLASADSDMQWIYAASFARGNNPIRAPWQPHFTPSYHLGEYFFEGSLYALSNLPLRTIHTINNVFLLSIGALMAIFIFWENKHQFKNFWLIISGLIVYLAFGVIIIIFPNFGLINSEQSLTTFFPTISSRNQIPSKVDYSGGGLVDLNSLSFLPARSLSIAFCILLLYFALTAWKNTKAKIASFVIVLSVIALVEESIFLPIFLTLFTVLLASFLPSSEFLRSIKENRKWLFSVLIFSIIISILQGGFVSEKIFGNGNSAFNLTLPFLSQAFTDKLSRFNNYFLTLDSTGQIFNLFIPSPLLLLLFALVISHIRKDKLLIALVLFSLINFLLFLTIEYKFASSNNIRFYNLGFIAAGFGFSYSIFLLIKDWSNRASIIYMLILALLMLPTFSYEFEIHSEEIKKSLNNKVTSLLLSTNYPTSPIDLIAEWADKHLPLNSQVLVVDKDFPTLSGSISFMYKGFYTLYSSWNTRVLRPEPGPEFFDLALTLNPLLFKQIGVEYLYMESESAVYKQLPEFRKADLENPNYFKLLTSTGGKDSEGKDTFYRLYEVNPNFLDPVLGGKNIIGKTLAELTTIIPVNSTVFINDYPALSFWYRMAVSLALKDRKIALTRRDQENPDFRNPYSGYMAIETDFNIIEDSKDDLYDFYILPPDKKPPVPADMIWSNLFASAWKKI